MLHYLEKRRPHLTTVIRYIQNQEQHHARRTFQQEYVALLDKFQVPHEARYLFKPVEAEA